MARASIPTLLSLDDWAAVMGITPPHFNTGAAVSLSPAVFPLKGNCDQVWWQYAWQQSDRVSREDLARLIAEAEDDVAKIVGYYPAPKWHSGEVAQWALPHRPDTWGNGLDSRGAAQSVTTKNKKVIAPGRRAVELIESRAAVVYSDEDLDGFDETATITIPGVDVDDLCEVKVYFVATPGAQPKWEIRPLLTKTLSLAGVLTITARSWLFIDPDLWEAFPTDNGAGIVDISTDANFVPTVDVYREYNDTTAVSAEFYWEPEWQPLPFSGMVCTSCSGTGCVVCSLTMQEGCLHVRNVHAGLVVPAPAVYTDGAWQLNDWSVCRAPDQIRMWYYAGDLSEEYRADDSCDPMSDEWKRIIAYIATARLERPICACGNAAALAEHLRVDLAETGSGRGGMRVTPTALLSNPLGTHRGEIIAWRKLKDLIGMEIGVATL